MEGALVRVGEAGNAAWDLMVAPWGLNFCLAEGIWLKNVFSPWKNLGIFQVLFLTTFGKGRLLGEAGRASWSLIWVPVGLAADD